MLWDTMEYFNALDVMAMPRLENSEADKLAVATSTLEFTEELIEGNEKFEINFRPSILDNLNHWQVFKDDKQIINFINNKSFQTFKLVFRRKNPLRRKMRSLAIMFLRRW